MIALESVKRPDEHLKGQKLSRDQGDGYCVTTQAAMIRLRASPYFALRILTCDFRRGHLVICGAVPTYYMKQVAQETVRPVIGVEKITNRVSVQSKATDFG
ncbi:MAG: BON domain-containing protein [Rubripirellula sp.]|nr:BON domain-containing protein [Rubripirellula sp.]